MRALRLFMVAALISGIPTAVMAQATTGGSTTSVDRTTRGDAGATGAAALPNQWIASGFVGSNFGNNAQNASTEFGTGVGYLWKSRYGAEFDVGVTPNFQLQNNFLGLGITPMINTYMANAVAAMPFGPDRKWQPFVSGGVGGVSLRSTLTSTQTDYNATRAGGDIGGGILGWAEHLGFKADVRYFRAAGSYNTTATYTPPGSSGTPAAPGVTPSPAPSPGPAPGPYGIGVASAASTTPPATTSAANTIATTTLSGLHFWRANVGVALRW